MLDKFSRFSYLRKHHQFVIFCCFSNNSVCIFRLSGAFCIDSAIFRPKLLPRDRFLDQNEFLRCPDNGGSRVCVCVCVSVRLCVCKSSY